MDPTKVVGRRVGAFVIDLILIWIINAAIFFALAKDPTQDLLDGKINGNTTVYGNLDIGDKTYSVYDGTAVAYFLIVLAIGLGYYVFLQGSKGWTVGKLLTGIRVQREDGSACRPGKAFLRGFMWIADGFPYFAYLFLVGFFVALNGDRHQRLGDRVAGTVVVDKAAFGQAVLKGGVPGGGSTAAPPPLAPEFQPQGTSAPPNWPS